MHILVKYENEYGNLDLTGYKLYTEMEWNEILLQMDLYFNRYKIFYFQVSPCDGCFVQYRSKEHILQHITIEYLHENELEDTFRYLPKQCGMYFPFELFWEC